MKLNPRGQVPTFVDDGVVVNESLATLLYLQDKYPQPSLLPATIEGRALVCSRPDRSDIMCDLMGQILVKLLLVSTQAVLLQVYQRMQESWNLQDKLTQAIRPKVSHPLSPL